jgi:hypothetical protein
VPIRPAVAKSPQILQRKVGDVLETIGGRPISKPSGQEFVFCNGGLLSFASLGVRDERIHADCVVTTSSGRVPAAAMS